MKFLLPLVLAFWFFGCSTGPRREAPVAASSQLQKRFTQLKNSIAKGQPQATSQLETLIRDNPTSSLREEMSVFLGDHFYQSRDFANAARTYQQVIEAPVQLLKEPEIRVRASRAFQQSNQIPEAKKALDPIFRMSNVAPVVLSEAWRVRSTLSLASGDRLESLRTLLWLSQNAMPESERPGHLAKAQDLVESRLNEQELIDVAGASEFSALRGTALYRLGMTAFEKAEYGSARSYLTSARSALQDGQAQERIDEIIRQLDARETVDPTVVGVILPLSGRLSKIGYKTLRGIQMGLGVYGKNKSRLKLAIMDSEASPDAARRAVRRLVVEDNAVALIGGIGKTATAEVTKAQELGVPTIALSQKAGLTETGPFVFRNSITSEMQVRHIVDIAMTQRGMSRFAILFPNDSYGIEYANLFWDEVLARGGKITAAQIYDPREKDFRDVVQRLAGNYYLEDRGAEYRQRLKDWQAELGPRAKAESPPKDLLPPVLDFEAIFIPDGAKAMGQIAPMLKYFEIEKVTLLGTNLWNTPELISRAGKYLEQTLFVDSLPPSTAGKGGFEKEFSSVFGYEPDAFEIQGYDAAIALRSLLSQGVSNRNELRDRLAQTQVRGALGTVNVSSSREFERPLTALTIRNGQILPASN